MDTAHIAPSLKLGLCENLPQFLLLAATTFGVGLVIGTERVVVPALGQSQFHLTSFLATLAGFVAGCLSSLARQWLCAGRAADRRGGRPLRPAGGGAAAMALSGLVVATLMYETLPTRRVTHLAWERDPQFQ